MLAYKPPDYEKWSEARRAAWDNLPTAADDYYKAYLPPGEKQLPNEWTAKELSNFARLLQEVTRPLPFREPPAWPCQAWSFLPPCPAVLPPSWPHLLLLPTCCAAAPSSERGSHPSMMNANTRARSEARTWPSLSVSHALSVFAPSSPGSIRRRWPMRNGGCSRCIILAARGPSARLGTSGCFRSQRIAGAAQPAIASRRPSPTAPPPSARSRPCPSAPRP